MTEIDEERWTAHRREHVLEDKALEVAADDVDRRLEAMNELRDQITSERAEYLTRTSFEDKHDGLDRRVGALEQSRSNMEGRMWAIGAGVVLVELALRFFHL